VKPGPIARTNRELDEELERKVKPSPKRLELEVMLRHTAADLLTAAWILLVEYYVTFPARASAQLVAPLWSHYAAQAFEALELLGIDDAHLDRFPAAGSFRPGVGEL
jgi:hypothetical protein